LRVKKVGSKKPKSCIKLSFSEKLKKDSVFSVEAKKLTVKVSSLKDREELRLKSAKAVSLLNREDFKSVLLPILKISMLL